MSGNSRNSVTPQQVLDAQGYLVLGDWVERTIGEIIPCFYDADRTVISAPAVVVIAKSTEAEFLGQSERFFGKDLAPLGWFYYRVTCE